MPCIRVNPQHPAVFASNVDILKPLAFDLKRYLVQYLKDEGDKVPQLPEELATDPNLVRDFKALFARAPVSAGQRRAFDKKFPAVAGKTEDLLKVNLTRRDMFADIRDRL